MCYFLASRNALFIPALTARVNLICSRWRYQLIANRTPGQRHCRSFHGQDKLIEIAEVSNWPTSILRPTRFGGSSSLFGYTKTFFKTDLRIDYQAASTSGARGDSELLPHVEIIWPLNDVIINTIFNQCFQTVPSVATYWFQTFSRALDWFIWEGLSAEEPVKFFWRLLIILGDFPTSIWTGRLRLESSRPITYARIRILQQKIKPPQCLRSL